MNGYDIRRPEKVGLILWALAILSAEPARAGLLGFQAQSEFDFTQYKQKGYKAVGRGRLLANYTLTLRRPFLPTSTLMSDLTLNSTQNGDYDSTQTTRGWTLNLYSTEPKYMLNGRISNSTYGASSGYLASSTGYTRDYNLGMFLRQPAWPVVNFQFRRNVSGTQFAGSTGVSTSTSWLMGASYDLVPLRFTVDRTRQIFGYSGSDTVRTNSLTTAMTLNHTLLPGLTLTGELSRLATNVNYTTVDTSTRTIRRLLRLTATPMRSVVADVALSSQTNAQDSGFTTGSNNNKAVSWSLRSEILPGLSLDYQDQKQTLDGSAYIGTRGSVSRNRNLNLAARLTEGTVFNITSTRFAYDMPASTYHARQNSIQAALQTSLTRTTDLSLNYGRSKSSTGASDNYDSTFQGFSVRDRTSPTLSLGATYRRNKTNSVITSGDSYDQSGDAVDLDMLWQPTYDVGINLRLSRQKNTGLGAYKSFAPAANIRWQVDSQTNLTANYTLQRFRPYDPTNVFFFGQDTRGLTLHMTHSFSNGAYLDAAYDFEATNVGDLEWHKQLRVSFTMTP